MNRLTTALEEVMKSIRKEFGDMEMLMYMLLILLIITPYHRIMLDHIQEVAIFYMQKNKLYMA